MKTTNTGVKKTVAAVQKTMAANEPIFDPSSPHDVVCDIFPAMPPASYEQLKESIRQNGLYEPIATQNGRIIDGRSRERACIELGIKPQYIELPTDKSALSFCVAKNLHRRHLTEFDKVLIAEKIGYLPIGSNQHTAGAERSQASQANMLHISPDTLQRGKKILQKGCPELKKAVQEGLISVSLGARIADLPQDQQPEFVASDDISITRMSAGINRAKAEKQRTEKVAEMLKIAGDSIKFDGKEIYSVVLADPPWDYLGFTGTPYPTMKTEDICKLDVASHCTPDSVAFIWVTSAMLTDGIKVLEAWGFKYVTCAVWDKVEAGQGIYFRQQHEILLLGTRGNPPKVDSKKCPPSVMTELRRDHSQKPDIVYEMIERMYPELPKVELFSRNKRKGWVMKGNQVGLKAANDD